VSDQEYTLYREPWFLSRDNDSEEWQITDGVEGFPMRNASDTEFGLALAGTLERDRAAHDAEVARAAAEKARKEALLEAADICQRIQDDPEFPESGWGVVTAKLVFRVMAEDEEEAERA